MINTPTTTNTEMINTHADSCTNLGELCELKLANLI